MVSAWQFGCSIQELLKHANYITLTQVMLIELADKF